jgi:hypothetical protein
LIERLKEHGEPESVGRALALALKQERDGWTVLKLLEIADQLQITAAGPVLIEIAGREPEDDRGKFLAGRACEVLLKLPLDLEARATANAVCRVPLEHMRRFRLGEAKERALHRPRKMEWLILVVLMVLALAGFFVAWSALR